MSSRAMPEGPPKLQARVRPGWNCSTAQARTACGSRPSRAWLQALMRSSLGRRSSVITNVDKVDWLTQEICRVSLASVKGRGDLLPEGRAGAGRVVRDQAVEAGRELLRR